MKTASVKQDNLVRTGLFDNLLLVDAGDRRVRVAKVDTDDGTCSFSHFFESFVIEVMRMRGVWEGEEKEEATSTPSVQVECTFAVVCGSSDAPRQKQRQKKSFF